MSWLVPSISFPHAFTSHLEITLHSTLLGITCPKSLYALTNLYKSNCNGGHTRQYFAFLFFSLSFLRSWKGEGKSRAILRWQRVLFPTFPLLFVFAICRALLIAISGLKIQFSPRSDWQKLLADALFLVLIFLFCCF